MTEKETHICTVECPDCHINIEVIKKTTVLQKAIPAEKEESYVARKVLQTTFGGK